STRRKDDGAARSRGRRGPLGRGARGRARRALAIGAKHAGVSTSRGHGPRPKRANSPLTAYGVDTYGAPGDSPRSRDPSRGRLVMTFTSRSTRSLALLAALLSVIAGGLCFGLRVPAAAHPHGDPFLIGLAPQQDPEKVFQM